MDRKQNESAYPREWLTFEWRGDPAYTSKAKVHNYERGLTKREIFAAMAMQGMCAVPGRFVTDDMARDAVACADSLLAALSRPAPNETSAP